jgi:hypothetical protein
MFCELDFWDLGEKVSAETPAILEEKEKPLLMKSNALAFGQSCFLPIVI